MKKTTKTKKMGRPPAKWLINLAVGTYTLTELSKISGRTKGSISSMFTRMGVKKQLGKHIIRNLHEVIYIWEGFDKENSD